MIVWTRQEDFTNGRRKMYERDHKAKADTVYKTG